MPIHEIVACGGLPEKNPLLMQIYADVTGRPFKLSASDQTPALGSAMFGAVAAGAAAGGYATIEDAARAMARLQGPTSTSRSPRTAAVYDQLYREYVRLHDYFGRGENDVMKTLRRPARRGRRRSTTASDRGGLTDASRSDHADELVRLHAELPRNGLVVWTGGNVSARDPRPASSRSSRPASATRTSRAETMVVVDLDGRVVEGDLKPSSDTASHLYVYRHRPDVNGVVHTHSRYATAFAAVGRSDPGLPHGPGRRVRRRDPVRRLRASSATRRSASWSSRGSATRRRSCSRTTASSRSGPTADGRGQGRGDDRGRRRDRLGAPSRSARPTSSPDDVVERLHRALHHATTASRPDRPSQESDVLDLSANPRSGSSPAASTCTARRRSRRSPSTPPEIAGRSRRRRRRSRSGSSSSRS